MNFCLTKIVKILSKTLYFTIILVFVESCISRNEKQNEKGQVTSAIKQVQVNWVANWLNREVKRKLLVDAAREFEFLNQDIKINIKFQEELCNNCPNVIPSNEDTIIKMMLSNYYNWDIVTLTQKNYSDIAAKLNDPEWGKKYLVNFEDFPWFKESHKSIIFENTQYRNDLGGIFAGPLIEGRYFSLWYNKNLANKIGLQIKPIGMTFEDFKGYIKQAFEYNQTATDKIQILFTKSNFDPVPELFNSLTLSSLGQLDTTKIDISNSLSALKRVLQACESLAGYNLSGQKLKSDNISDAMLDEKVLFGGYVSSYYNSWESINKEKAQNMVPVESPTFEHPCIIFRGSYQSVWAVFKYAPHCNEAIKFMQYMCSNDIAEKWISSTKNPTGLKVRINASDLTHDDIAKFNTGIEKKYGNNMRNYDINQLLFGPKTTIKIDATQVINGTLSADEYYNQIVKQLKKQK
jgi:hypothetical protein